MNSRRALGNFIGGLVLTVATGFQWVFGGEIIILQTAPQRSALEQNARRSAGDARAVGQGVGPSVSPSYLDPVPANEAQANTQAARAYGSGGSPSAMQGGVIVIETPASNETLIVMPQPLTNQEYNRARARSFVKDGKPATASRCGDAATVVGHIESTHAGQGGVVATQRDVSATTGGTCR